MSSIHVSLKNILGEQFGDFFYLAVFDSLNVIIAPFDKGRLHLSWWTFLKDLFT